MKTNDTNDTITTPYHQDYDKLIKENIDKNLPIILAVFCGIKNAKIRRINSSQQRTHERRADVVLKVYDENGKALFIIHLEFQASNDPNMPFRMLHYRCLFSEKYGLPVRQFVIYIGKEKMRMIDHIQQDDLSFRYHLSDIRNVPYRTLLDADTPEGCILAILGNFGGKNKKTVIREILEVLKFKTKTKILLKNYTAQLLILAQLRNLHEETNHQINNDMALSILDFYDITIDPRYKPYFQEERSQGKLEGKLELSYSIAEKMLIQGTSTNSQIAELTELSLQEVQFIQKRLSDAGSLAKN